MPIQSLYECHPRLCLCWPQSHPRPRWKYHAPESARCHTTIIPPSCNPSAPPIETSNIVIYDCNHSSIMMLWCIKALNRPLSHYSSWKLLLSSRCQVISPMWYGPWVDEMNMKSSARSPNVDFDSKHIALLFTNMSRVDISHHGHFLCESTPAWGRRRTFLHHMSRAQRVLHNNNPCPSSNGIPRGMYTGYHFHHFEQIHIQKTRCKRFA